MKSLNACSPAAAALVLSALAPAAGASAPSFRFHASALEAPSALYDRMAARAEALCETQGRKPLRQIAAERTCASGLLDEFVAGAASPTLSALHAEARSERLAGLR